MPIVKDAIAIILLLSVYALVSTLDYRDSRELECAEYAKSYNPSKDICERSLVWEEGKK